MEIYLAISAAILVGIFFYEKFNTNSNKEAPYLKIKNKLESDFEIADFSGDWEQKQQLNLHLLWLRVIKESANSGRLDKPTKNEELSYISNLRMVDIKFPNTDLDLNNDNHFYFCLEVINNLLLEIQNDKSLICSPKVFTYPKKYLIEMLDVFKKIIPHYTETPIKSKFFEMLPKYAQKDIIETVKLIDWQLKIEISEYALERLEAKKKNN